MNSTDSEVTNTATSGWRRNEGMVSLPEVHRSVTIPKGASFWRKLLAFSGPGFLVAVGYMDPGNWATDLAGGAQLRLHAAVSHHDFQSDGDPAPASLHQAGRRHRARSGAGLPRPLFTADGVVPVGAVRDRHCRMRSGGGHRLGDRAATAIRHPAGVGLLHHLPRRAGGADAARTRASATSRRW